MVSAKQKKVEQSIADSSQAIDLDPAYTKAYLRRAMSYMDAEQYEEAVRDYKHLFKMDKSSREYSGLTWSTLAAFLIQIRSVRDMGTISWSRTRPLPKWKCSS